LMVGGSRGHCRSHGASVTLSQPYDTFLALQLLQHTSDFF
jgi:hypothetical protein